jgi:hypothetical protein
MFVANYNSEMSDSPETHVKRPRPRLGCILLVLVVMLLAGGAWWWRSQDIGVQVERIGGHFRVAERKTNAVKRIINRMTGEGFSRRHSILFWGSQVDDEWLRDHRGQLADLSDLSLQLGQTAITDRALQHLAGLQNITDLSVYETDVTDDGMPAVASMTNLRALEISHTKVSGAGLQHVLSLPRLQRLQVSGSRITADDLAHLAEAPMLNSVVIDASQATDRGIANVFACPKLNGHLTITDADDDAVMRLAAWPELRALLLQGHGVTDASVPALSMLQGLEHLNLLDTSVTEDGQRQLQQALSSCRVDRRETPRHPSQLK